MTKFKPSAVGSFDYEADTCKGKNHPSAVNGGLGGVTGRAPKQPSQSAASGGSAHYPSAIAKHDGAANTKADEKHLTSSTPKTAFVGKRSTIPAAVRKGDGLSASKG